VIALKPVIHGRALEVVLYHPRKGDAVLHRVWPVVWRGLALGLLGGLAVAWWFSAFH
jgi:hypothetical protein